MSPRSKDQFEQIRNARRFHILESALVVFAEDGFHQASIAKIAHQAKISKGLIYNYFESKDDLLKAVLIAGTDSFKESYEFADEELNTPEKLELFIKGGIDIMQTKSDYFKLYFSVLFQPAAREIVRANYQEIMGDLLSGAAGYFESRGDPHPIEKASILAALLDGLGIHYLLAPDQYDLVLYEKIIFDLFK